MTYHKSAVTNAVATGQQFTNTYGTFYVHAINFADGNFGDYNSKDPNQLKFAPGTGEVDYEFIPTDNPNHRPKVKPYNPEYSNQPPLQSTAQAQQPQGGVPVKPQFTQQEAINRTVALKVAVESTDLKAEGVSKALEYAEHFSNWLDGYAQSFQEPKKAQLDDDGIPF